MVCLHRLSDRTDVGPEGQCDSFSVSARCFAGAGWVRNLGGGDRLELIHDRYRLRLMRRGSGQ